MPILTDAAFIVSAGSVAVAGGVATFSGVDLLLNGIRPADILIVPSLGRICAISSVLTASTASVSSGMGAVSAGTTYQIIRLPGDSAQVAALLQELLARYPEPRTIGDVGFTGRLTLVKGEPFATADVVSAFGLWIEPVHTGGPGLAMLWDGAAWKLRIWTSFELKSRVTLPATSVAGSATVSVASTGLALGMTVMGTGIPAGAVVAAIPSAGSVTLSAAATAPASSLTFRLPANAIHDVFCRDNGTATPDFIWGRPWIDDMQRHPAGELAWKDGALVLAADPRARLLGTVGVMEFDGQLADSDLLRYVSSLFHPVPKPLRLEMPQAAWNPAALNAWSPVAGNPVHSVRYVACVPRVARLTAMLTGQLQSDPGNGDMRIATGIGVDRSDTDYSQLRTIGQSIKHAANIFGTIVSAQAQWSGDPGLGRHRLFWLEHVKSASARTSCFLYGTAQNIGMQDLVQSGLIGSVDA